MEEERRGLADGSTVGVGKDRESYWRGEIQEKERLPSPSSCQRPPW